MSEWTFSLRKGRAHDCDSDASEEEVPTSLSASTLPETAGQHDKDDETVQFQESPWTIAKMNAASRKKDNMTQNAPDTPSFPHQPVAPIQNAPNRMLELLPKRQIMPETAIQRRSERPSAAVHTENAATKILSKPSMAHHAVPLRSLQFPQSTLKDWTRSKPVTSYTSAPKTGELCMKLHSPARNTPQQPDTTHALLARTTNRTPSSPFSAQATTDPLANSGTSIPAHGVQLPAKLRHGKSFKQLGSRDQIHNSSNFSTVASMSSPAYDSMPRKGPGTALRCPRPQPTTAMSPKFRSANTHRPSPMTVTRPSTSFVTSLIAETLSQRRQHIEESQADPLGESQCSSDVWWSSGPPKLTQYPENSSHGFSEGAVRNIDDLRSLEETSVETPIAAYAQKNVKIARLSPYLTEDFSPLRSPPITMLPNETHLEQGKISVQESPLASKASRECRPPLMLPASSPSPSPLRLPQRRPTRPLTSLPVPGKSRPRRPRISRVDLDRDTVWSTLPSRKRKTRAPNHKGGITTTARFSLPIALPSADNALTETANLRTKTLYRPPPHPPRAGLNQGGSQEGGKPGNAGISSADEGATGWGLVKITPSMLKDPKFLGTGAGKLHR